MIERNRYQVSASTSQVLSFLNITITLSFLLKIIIGCTADPAKKLYFHCLESV